MIRGALSIVLVIVICTGCAEYFAPSFQGSREYSWALQVAEQCRASTSAISNEDCIRLLDCVEEVGRTFFYDPYSSHQDKANIIRTYNRIVPFDTDEIFPLYSMSFLRERAEKAGPRAVALFAEMEDARNVCLAETGMTERIGYN